MLKFSQEYFSSEDTATLKEWLRAPGSFLFQRVVRAEMAVAQVEASNTAVRVEPGKQRFAAEAEKKLEKVTELQRVLDTLERMGGKDFTPYRVKIEQQ